MAQRSGNNRIDYKEKSKWMVQYNSTAIFNDKLQHMENPEWELENLEQIEQKFQEFTDEYQKKVNVKPVYTKRREGRIDLRHQNPNQKKNVRGTVIQKENMKLDELVKQFEQSQQSPQNEDNKISTFTNNNVKSKDGTSKNAYSRKNTSKMDFIKQSSTMKSNKLQQHRMLTSGSTISTSEYETHNIGLRKKNTTNVQTKERSESIDSEKEEKIQEMIERLQFKSYAKFKDYEKEKKKVIKFTAEDLEKEKRITKSANWQQIHGKIQDEFQRHEDNTKLNLNQENPATDVLGNHLISVLFQALLLKQVQNHFGIKFNIDSGIPISDKLIDIFGININFMKSLRNESERRSYLIKTMNARIDMLLKDWNNEIIQREKKYKKEDQQIQQEKQKIKEDEEDQFQWLDIKTKHATLRKKLRVIIIQKMNEYENHTKFLEKFENIKTPLSSEDRNRLGTVFLSGIPNISTKTVISRMKQEEGELLKKLETKHNKSQQKQSQPDSNTITEEQFAKELNNCYDDHDEEAAKVFEWDQNIENQYKNNKKDAKKLYYDDITTSNWSELGFLPLVQKYNLDNRKNLKREVILNKYCNSDNLNPQELKFIADTSKLLNSCLDKQFLQTSVQNIDPESLHQLELNLAENIISNYQNMKIEIKEARTKYVNQKVKDVQKLNVQQINKWKKEKEIQEWKNYHKKHSKLVQKEVQRIEKKRPILFAYQENTYFRIFVNIIKDKLQNIRRRKEIEAKALQEQGMFMADINKLDKHEDVSLKEKRDKQNENMKKLSYQIVLEEKNEQIKKQLHRLHPPSKLPLYPQQDDDLSKEQELDRMKERKQKMENKIQQFKLGTRSHSEARVQTYFNNFYSNGPIQPKPSYIPGNMDFQPITPSDLQKVQTLQKRIKQHKMKSVVDKIKNKHINQKIKEHQQRLSDLGKGKYLNHATANFIEQTRTSTNNNRSHQNFTSIDNSNCQTEIAEQRIQELEGKLNKINQSHISGSTNYINNERYITHESQERLTTYEQSDAKNQVRFDQQSNNKNMNIQNQGNYIAKSYISNNNNNNQSFGNKSVSSLYYTPKKGKRPLTAKLDQKLQKLMNSTEKQQNVKNQQKCKSVNYGNAGFLMSQLKQKHQTLLNSARRKQFQHIQFGKYEYNKEDFKQLDNNNCSALHYTVLNEDIEFTKWILQSGGSPNIRSMNDNSPLHLAFKIDNFELIGLLLEYGADLNFLNAEGMTPPGLGQSKTLQMLNLQNAVVQSKSKDMYGSVEDQFDNNKLLTKEIQDFIKEEKLEIKGFYPLQGRDQDQPTVKIEDQSSM